MRQKGRKVSLPFLVLSFLVYLAGLFREIMNGSLFSPLGLYVLAIIILLFAIIPPKKTSPSTRGIFINYCSQNTVVSVSNSLFRLRRRRFLRKSAAYDFSSVSGGSPCEVISILQLECSLHHASHFSAHCFSSYLKPHSSH